MMRAQLQSAARADKYLSSDIAATDATDVICDGRHLPLRTGSVDVAVALEVLEHVPDPSQAMTELGRVVRSGGALVLSVPFMFGRHDLADFQRFTGQGLRGLAERHGFEVEELHHCGGTLTSITVLFGNLLRSRIVGPSRGWRASSRLRWAIATVVISPLALVSWIAYALDAAIDRGSDSPPGFLLLATRVERDPVRANG